MKTLIGTAALLACICGASLSAQAAAGPRALAWQVDDPGLEWGPCPDFLPTGCEIAVLHGDPAAANADVFFRVPGGAEIVRHWHTSAERMVLVAGELHVTYDGHPSTVLTPGSYAYGPPRLPHAARCIGDTACVLVIAFEQAVDAFEGGHASD